MTELHDRTKDNFDDEMLFCVQPIPLKYIDNLKFGIKADAVIVDGDTKRIYCEVCYEGKRKTRAVEHASAYAFDDVSTQIRYRPLEQNEMKSLATQTTKDVFDTPFLPN